MAKSLILKNILKELKSKQSLIQPCKFVTAKRRNYTNCSLLLISEYTDFFHLIFFSF